MIGLCWTPMTTDCLGRPEEFPIAYVHELQEVTVIGWVLCNPSDPTDDSLCPVYAYSGYHSLTGNTECAAVPDPPLNGIEMLRTTSVDAAGNADTEPCP
jgi:hypothetical protein